MKAPRLRRRYSPLRLLKELRARESRLHALNRRLQRLATLDSLTGLKNHGALMKQLRQERYQAIRAAQPFSIVLLDVDYFKQYNDAFGHLAGDHALKLLARRLEQHARPADFIARYGGEEFAALLANTDRSGAMRWAEALRLAIARAGWPARPITVSVGAATLTFPPQSIAFLLAQADIALYQSKNNGRNRTTHAAQLSWNLPARQCDPEPWGLFHDSISMLAAKMEDR